MISRVVSHTVAPGEAGRAVRSILMGPLGLSGSLVTRLKQRPGAVLLNGAPARTIDRVSAGDVVSAEVGDVREGGRFVPMARRLSVLYEDEDLIIIDKPADMATHGRAERGECTVANAVAAYLGTERPFHPVNRLDRGTTGCLCAAKTGYAHELLRRTLHSESFRREYLAIATGVVIPTQGVIELPMMKIADKKFGVREGGARAVTRYETLAGDGRITLLRVAPETGRTHQIRVHFSALGYPLLGDRLYGGASAELGRPALHSRSLRLLQPVTGEEISVFAPLPEDMREVLTSHEISTDQL